VARLGPSPDAAALAEALAIYGPDDVVVVLGDDLAPSAADALVALAEAGGYALWGTQLTSRVAFPAAHPCWAGVLKPDFAEMRARLAGLKALVLVGGRAFVAYPYRAGEPVPVGVKIFHVAEAPEAFGREHAADLALLGDIPSTLAVAAAALRAKVDSIAVAARIAARAKFRATHAAATRAEILAASTTSALSSDAAVLAVFDALPDDALIANDSAATFGAVQELMATRPGRYFFSRGGVLGCNMPAAVGAALQHAGPVVSLVGDGGAMYSPQALWSAAHQRAHVVFFVFNNRRYGVLQNVARQLGCANALAGRFVGMDVTDPPVDFLALAAAMGVPAERAENREAIAAAAKTAFARSGPSLIEIPVK
jgi:benzoylformate decarboxylase